MKFLKNSQFNRFTLLSHVNKKLSINSNLYTTNLFNSYKNYNLGKISVNDVIMPSFIKNNFKFTKGTNNLCQIFLNNSIRGGGKIKILNYLNKINSLFFFNFIRKSKFMSSKFNMYNILLNFSKSNEFFFDLNFILNNIIQINESIFVTKMVKLDKKLKKKSKSKFDIELKYLHKNKRTNNVLKSLNLYCNNFNYYHYYERLLASVVTTIFEQKNSYLYKKKIHTYSNVLKKKFKK